MNQLDAILLLKSGKSLLGVEIRYVREIISDFPVFPLPIPLSGISHLTLIRGIPYAILNNEHYLQLEHKIREKLVVLIGQMAISVDDAVQPVSSEELSVSEDVVEAETPYIKHVVQYRNRIIPILDIQAILNDKPEFELISI